MAETRDWQGMKDMFARLGSATRIFSLRRPMSSLTDSTQTGRSSGRSSTLSLTLRRVSARSQSRRARPMSHSSLLAGRSPGFKRRRRTASISVCGWKGGSPRGASSPRRFKRPCRFKLDSRHLMRWIQRCSVGCNKRMTRTADRAPNQSVRTNSFPSGSAIVAFQFPHGFFSGRSVTVPPFRSIARAARFTSSTEK